MKKFRKVFAVILSLAMILGMSMTAFADETARVPAEGDTVEISISGIGQGATVKLYRIAGGIYGSNGAAGFVEYAWVNGTEFANVDAPTADEINAIAQGIKNNEYGNIEVLDAKATIGADGKFTYEATAGAYIAIIEGSTEKDAEDNSIYNPILLTASYGTAGAPSGTLQGGSIDLATAGYIGTAAVAKKTTPDVDKEIVDGTTSDGNRETASIGDVITYQITPTMPSYPANATNKTLLFADTMSDGLTFIFDSLQMGYAEDPSVMITGTKDANGNIIFNDGTNNIATAYEVGNGFSISFEYDALMQHAELLPDDVDNMMLETYAVYTPVIRYSAVLNDKAVVGDPGNPNEARMYYANKPNTGSTFKPSKENPEPNGEVPGLKKKEDKEIVYTYQLAFLKTGEGADATKLAGAVFGIYTDENCTNLVDVVKTNAEGYAVSSKVEVGTYYIKELLAPADYSLNDKVYSITASWKSTTTTIKTEERAWKYTTVKPSEDAEQIGWIDTKDTETTADDVFYSLENKPEISSLMPAFVVYDNATVTTDSTIETAPEGAGTASTIIDLNSDAEDKTVSSIPNTKLTSLPSTGGIGTTIFTIGGCAIMIIAAALFFASRRKSAK